MSGKCRGRRVRIRRKNFKFDRVLPAGTPAKVAEELKMKVMLGIIAPGLAKDEKTIDGFWEQFLGIYPSICKGNCEASTVKKLKSMYRKHIKPYFGDWSLRGIRPEAIVLWQDRLRDDPENPQSAQSTRNIRTLLSLMFQEAFIRGYCDYNPVKSTKAPKRPRTHIDVWTQDEKNRFLDMCIEEDFELAQIVAFALDTGMRIGELDGLRGDCLDLRNRTVYIRRHFCYKTRDLKDYCKHQSQRQVTFTEEVAALLENKWALAPDEKVFNVNWNTLPYKRLDPMCEKAKVKRLTFHQFRHTFASHLIMLKKNVKEVAAAMGHRNTTTTWDTYVHLFKEYERTITDGLNSGASWAAKLRQKSGVVVPAKFGR